MFVGRIGDLPACPTPYFGPIDPWSTESGCVYYDSNGACCDPSGTFQQNIPPTQTGNTQSLPPAPPNRTCQLPMMSIPGQVSQIYYDKLGYCSPLFTNFGSGGSIDSTTILLLGGIATLALVASSGGGGGGYRRRR